nr:cellodextrin phosphorylase [uncultured bacterium]
MNFGYFDDEHREYVITDPHTPVKWINYIGTLAFGGFVDHTGGALICARDPALDRITKYISQMPDSDFKGETMYVRLHSVKGLQILSPFFVPTLTPLNHFECSVGLGYSRWTTEIEGLCCELTVFIPTDAPVEIRDISITNLRRDAVELDAVPVVEYTHPDALKQLTNADWVPQTMQSRAESLDGRTVLLQYPFMLRDRQVNYFTASIEAGSFETDRRAFLGANGYGSWQHPLGLEAAELGNHQALRGDNIAALLLHLGTLQPGDTVRFITLLGQAPSLDAAGETIRRYRQPAAVEAAFADLAHFWKKYLSVLQVRTPDADFDRMINIHNPRQCWITTNWSRYLSLYQLGYGARGIGFRDSSQDGMAILASAPETARALLRSLLSVQKRDGSAMHQFNPLNMIASEGDSLEREDRPHYYSDDHLWAVLAVTAYLKETGNLAFLDEELPYYEKDKNEQPLEFGTVLDHLERGLAFTRREVGQHGLPLLGFADWNDTINLPTGAESLFTANLYGRALCEMVALCTVLGNPDAARDYRRDYDEMKKLFEAVAWDGEWYVRYFDADGQAIGSHVNAAGQIYLNGQTWPVISGFASPERGRQAMDKVRERLNTPNGIKLSAPGFKGYDPGIGGITTYPPGAKENGGIFLHTNPWAVIAETLLGRGERAFEYYRQINPATRNDRIEEYECEPYVYPQNILGDEHPQFGLARNAWLSGTSSWAYQAGTQYILGLRPEYDGLCLDPCIPPQWDGFAVTRQFRGSTYAITVHNPRHTGKGIRRLLVDGQEIAGALIPLPGICGDHQVEAWI